MQKFETHTMKENYVKGDINLPDSILKTLLVLHLNPLLFHLRQILKEALALPNHILDQLFWESCLAEIQESNIQQYGTQISQELRLRRWIERPTEREDRERGKRLRVGGHGVSSNNTLLRSRVDLFAKSAAKQHHPVTSGVETRCAAAARLVSRVPASALRGSQQHNNAGLFRHRERRRLMRKLFPLRSLPASLQPPHTQAHRLLECRTQLRCLVSEAA